VIITAESFAVGGGAITTYFNVLGLNKTGTSGHRTHDLPDAKRERYHQANQIKLYSVTPPSFFMEVNVKSKSKSGIETIDTSPIPERFMKMKFLACVFFNFFFSFLNKNFQNDSTTCMTSEPLDVFSVC
jgi:hypothetical protein